MKARVPGLVAVVALVALVLPAAGCADRQSSADAADASSADPQPSSADPTPTQPPGPAATGPLVRMEPLTFHVPAHFKPYREFGGLSAGGGHDGDNIIVTRFPAMAHLGEPPDIDGMARRALKFNREGGIPKMQRLPDVTVEGVTMYHLFGHHGCCGLSMTEYGTEVRGDTVTMQFSMETTGAARDRLIASVLNTIHWRP